MPINPRVDAECSQPLGQPVRALVLGLGSLPLHREECLGDVAFGGDG